MNDLSALLPYVKLRFNLKHPSFEECYDFGYECARQGIAENENPFTEGTSKHEQWAEGWWMGYYEEKPLFANNTDDKLAKVNIFQKKSANEHVFKQHVEKFWLRALEITGVIAASAFIGYQVLELVA